MIRHILFIKLRPDASAEAIEAVRLEFLAFMQCVPGVMGVEWGENNSPEGKNAGFTHCVLMTFVDAAARDGYLPHEAHQKFIPKFQVILEDIIVLDYHIDQMS